MPKTFRFFKWTGKKAVAFCVLSTVLAMAAIGATLAFIFDKTDPIENSFPPAEVELQIAGNNIVNTGDVPAYFRAAVIFTWVNHEDGTILSKAPKVADIADVDENGDGILDENVDKDRDGKLDDDVDIDCVIHINTEHYWARGSDGFLYYTVPLDPSQHTAQVITDVTLTHQTIYDGYAINVQVLAEAIQSTPAEAVEQSWGVSVNADGTLAVGGTN